MRGRAWQHLCGAHKLKEENKGLFVVSIGQIQTKDRNVKENGTMANKLCGIVKKRIHSLSYSHYFRHSGPQSKSTC